MTSKEAAQRWRDTWEQGWTNHDLGPILALYSDGAMLLAHPFREPRLPAEYLRPTFAAERSTQCWFGDPIAQGVRAAVEWHAETMLVSGGVERLAGVSLLRFDATGLAIEQRDVWTAPDGG